MREAVLFMAFQAVALPALWLYGSLVWWLVERLANEMRESGDA